jgi:hypothetical protein
MNSKDSLMPKLWNAVRATVLGLLAYAGLACAAGLFPWFTLPEEATIPLYILLYSFLGSVAYLLSALLGDYKLLSSEEKELEKRKEELKEEREMLEKEGAKPDIAVLDHVDKNLDKVETRLEKLRKYKVELINIPIKLARIPFGMIMAAAFYLVAKQLLSEIIVEALGTELLAGCAFLIAFFPKVIMEAFHGLASRLIGRGTVQYEDMELLK